MNYYAKILDSKIVDIYQSVLNFDNFQKAFGSQYLFIDVTGTRASVGDIVNLNGDGSCSIEKGPQWKSVYSVPDIVNTSLDRYRDELICYLNDICKNFLQEAFLCQSVLHVKISTELEKEALEYKKSGNAGILLRDIATIEEISLDQAADQIMQTYNRIVEANAIVMPFYCKWKTYINGATTVTQLKEIEEEMRNAKL